MGIIVAGWDVTATAETLRLIEGWVRANHISVAFRLLATTHATNMVPSEYRELYQTLQVSNDALDVGAISDGIAASQDHVGPGSTDVLMLCNDRLAHYERTRPILRYVNRGTLPVIMKHKVLVGKLMTWPSDFAFGHLTGASWIQSHCLFVSDAFARRIRLERRYRDPLADSLSHEGSSLRDEHGSLDPKFLVMLNSALIVRPDAPTSSWRWPGARDERVTDFDYLVKKARSIVRERIVSLQAIDSGGALVDARALPEVAQRDMLRRPETLLRRSGLPRRLIHRFLGV